MKIKGNPFVDEGIRAYFAQGSILRTYLLVPGALGLILLAVWPRGSFESALRATPLADTFTVVAAGFLGFLLYLSTRYGSEDFSPDSLVQLREYVTLTPVSLFSVVAGKAGFAVMHTLFLLTLGAPFLLASLAVAGVSLTQAFWALAVIGAAGLAARMYGLLVLTIVGERALTRDLILIPTIVLYLIVTLLFLPAVNPFSAVMSLSLRNTAGSLRQAVGSVSPSSFCALIDLGVALLLAGAVFAVLHGTRRRARVARSPDA